MKSFLLVTIAFLFLFSGCGKKAEPFKVGELTEYRDPAYGFKVKYPKEWKNLARQARQFSLNLREWSINFWIPVPEKRELRSQFRS